MLSKTVERTYEQKSNIRWYLQLVVIKFLEHQKFIADNGLHLQWECVTLKFSLILQMQWEYWKLIYSKWLINSGSVGIMYLSPLCYIVIT